MTFKVMTWDEPAEGESVNKGEKTEAWDIYMKRWGEKKYIPEETGK